MLEVKCAEPGCNETYLLYILIYLLISTLSTVLRQVHPDQDLQLGQRAGHPGGEQVRHGGREGHLLRAGQAARRQSRTPIL